MRLKKKHAHEIHHNVKEDKDVLSKINSMTLDYAPEMDSPENMTHLY